MEFCQNCGKEVMEAINYCPWCGKSLKKTTREEYNVSSDDLVRRIKELIHEGNVTRIIVKNEKGEILFEMPATVGVIGTVLVPWAAALGVIAAIASRCRIVVEKREETS